MKFEQYIKRALSLPPHIVLLKVFQLLLFRFKAVFVQLKDRLCTTYSEFEHTQFQKIFPVAPDPQSVTKFFPELPKLVENTLRHEHDLLASGWVKVNYNMSAKGILDVHYRSFVNTPPRPGTIDWVDKHINRSNRERSAEVWKLISDDYEPIDWHIDFKSGYRWNSKTWWFNVPYGHKRGVDIKVPWELSRCQHLPWLALEYGKTNDSRLGREFQNQVLDFIATNPPKFGVNWRCAMDVAIRASNWILTYEWLRLYGWQPSEQFRIKFSSSLADHGRYIYNNLEIGKDGFRGNHYLADICGLVFISNFLPNSIETGKWQSFSCLALRDEMSYQFYAEGSNFEGSTSYHRLSAEMILYSSIIFILKEPDSFSQDYIDRLYRMAKFSTDVTRPDGNIVQIGDCDSGRFFKIQPIFRDGHLTENHLTHFCLIDAIKTLFKTGFPPSSVEGHWIGEMNLSLRFLDTPVKYKNTKEVPPLNSHALLENLTHNNFPSEKEIKELKLPYQIQLIPHNFGKSKLICYNDFGLYLWKSESSFLSFRCGSIGQNGRGGHDHNDQLSVEIYDSGRLVMSDPGTAVYTPFPEIRNKYRSITSHSSPIVKDESGRVIEPCPLNQGLFSLNGKQGSILLASTSSIIVGYNAKLNTARVLELKSDFIKITDICFNKNWSFSKQPSPMMLSKGYGYPLESL